MIERTPNTFEAHRLIWYAAQQGKQDEVVETLFRAYFLEGQDIGDVQVACRDRCRLSDWIEQRPKRFLASEQGDG